MLDDYEFDLDERPRTRGEVDAEVHELAYGRRLGMAARRASDVFVWAGMFSTAQLLCALADEADMPACAAASFFDE